jgi:hypothetical protein
MNLIRNGSFEKAAKGFSPPTGNGEALASGSKAIAGWTVFGGVSGDGLAWLPNGNGFGGSTPYGSDFLDLTGYHDAKPYFGIEQTISTAVGTTYDLTFHLGVDNNTPIYSGPISVAAAAGSTSQDFNYDPKKTGNVWGKFTLEFTATSTKTLISFQGLSGDQYIGLDSVAVVAADAPAARPGGGRGLAERLRQRPGGAAHRRRYCRAPTGCLGAPHACARSAAHSGGVSLAALGIASRIHVGRGPGTLCRRSEGIADFGRRASVVRRRARRVARRQHFRRLLSDRARGGALYGVLLGNAAGRRRRHRQAL